jgi:hypothetical protein
MLPRPIPIPILIAVVIEAESAKLAMLLRKRVLRRINKTHLKRERVLITVTRTKVLIRTHLRRNPMSRIHANIAKRKDFAIIRTMKREIVLRKILAKQHLV